MSTDTTRDGPWPELQEAALEYLYGDGEADPGELVAAAADADGFGAWLTGLEGDLAAIVAAAGAAPEASLALARLGALREEVAARRASRGRVFAAGASATAPAGGAVVSLAEARARRGRRAAAVIGGVLAIAAGVMIAVVAGQEPATTTGPGPAVALRPTVEQAQAWAADLEGDGMAFAGAERSPRDRGFLIGLARDLSAPGADGAPASDEAIALARHLALLALAGVVEGDDGEAARVRAVRGCREALGDAASGDDVAACEGGLADYARHRDAALAPRPAP